MPVPEKAYGNFFEGHCYVVLHVSGCGVCVKGSVRQPRSLPLSPLCSPCPESPPLPTTPVSPAPSSFSRTQSLCNTFTSAPTLDPSEPQGQAGGAQQPALLGWEDGNSRGTERCGCLHAAPARVAGVPGRAAPGGTGPRIRLLLQLLPPGSHVSGPASDP